jgi:serine/threonine-protein kinase
MTEMAVSQPSVPVVGIYIADVVAAGFILLGLGMFFLARSGRMDHRRLLDLGLVFEVVAAAGIEAHLAFGAWPADLQFTGLSWVCVWIVFFPLVVPANPVKMTIAALAAATTVPVLYAIGLAVGGDPLDASIMIQYFVSPYICVVLALLGARVIHRMHTDIRRAREMGSYRLVEKLGEGGMGEVWKAEHRMLARPAAIKLVRRDDSGSDSSGSGGTHLHRFEREVQATAQLRSPHTVEVYDYGLTEDRTFYYVMELLDGLSLEEFVQEYGPMPAERVVHVLSQMCHSLAEAHEGGLVHRDIKPANIFLCRYGRDFDFVKVLDFGLVKQAGGRRTEPKLTAFGTFAGTPAYGSPETALAESQDVDGRSDIYSMGCVAFWLLTGRTVFGGPTPMRILVQHVNEEPPSPSAVTELEIPEELDRLVLACLRKSRDERPASADALREALQAVPLTRPWTPDRAHQWWDRHRPMVKSEPPAAVTDSGTRLPVVKP